MTTVAEQARTKGDTMSNRTMIAEARDLLPAARRHVEAVATAHGLPTDGADDFWALTGHIESRLRNTPASQHDSDLTTAYLIAQQADALTTFLALIDCCEAMGAFDVDRADDTWADYYVRRVDSAASTIRKHVR